MCESNLWPTGDRNGISGKVLTISVVILVFNSMIYCRRLPDVGASSSCWRVQTSLSRLRLRLGAQLTYTQHSMQTLSLLVCHLRCVCSINTWNPENMENANEEFRQQVCNPSGQVMSMRSMARAWQVPYRTLRNRLVGKVKGYRHVSGRPPVLSQHEEGELFNVITKMAEVGFPLTRSDIRKLAFEYAQKNNLKCFSDSKKSAGYYWFDNFMTRFPQLRVKKAENLSAARAMSVNEVRVKQQFEEYSSLLRKLGVEDSPGHLWNIDETRMQNIHDAKRVVGLAGEHVYNITAMEKGETSTYLAGINAVGKVVPPLIIHKGKTVGKKLDKWCTIQFCCKSKPKWVDNVGDIFGIWPHVC